MSVTTDKPLDLVLLTQQLADAGIVVTALGHSETVVHDYTPEGTSRDLPATAQPVVDAHDYTQGSAYQLKQADTTAIDAFHLGWVLGQARLGNVGANAIQNQMDAIQAANIGTVAQAAVHIKTLAEAVEDLARQLRVHKRTTAIATNAPDRLGG